MCLYVGIHVPRWRSEDNSACQSSTPNILAKFWVLFLFLLLLFVFVYICFVLFSCLFSLLACLLSLH